MKYSIGEFAELLGITVDTLRLYEKHSIVQSGRDDNHYRYYNELDARNLLMSRWYRSLRVPLKEVADFSHEVSLDKVSAMTGKIQDELEEKIKKDTLLLNKIREIRSELGEVRTDMNQCRIRSMPGIYRLKQTHINDFIDSDFIRAVVGQWMSLLPYTFYSFLIEKTEIYSEQETFDYNWGLAISEKDVRQLDFQVDDNIEYIPPQTYLSSIIFVSNQERFKRDSLSSMFDQLNSQHYEIQGDVIGKILFTEIKDSLKGSYLNVNIPIKLP